MLSWNDIYTNLQDSTVVFEGLSDEESVKYYIAFSIQVFIFEEMDNAIEFNKDPLKKDILIELYDKIFEEYKTHSLSGIN